MTGSAGFINDKAFDNNSVPGGAVSKESILCTEQLHRRPSRPPDYEKENRAFVSLAQALADSPQTILQTLADMILESFQCGSAGLSLLTTHDGGKRFYWPAIAGVWKPHIGGGTPRDFGPCGDVLDRNTPLMFTHFERLYTYLPPVEECLLVPFYVAGKAAGTIWAVAHDDRRKFDAEDLRQLVSLGQFASAAWQLVQNEEQLRTLAYGLETQVHARTQELEQRNAEVVGQSERLRDMSIRLMRLQDEERRHIARDLHDSTGQVVTALGLNLANISRHVGRHPPLGEVLEESEALIQQLGKEIRTVSYLLHPPLLEEIGLSEAIHSYTEGLTRRSGLKIELCISKNCGRFPCEMELTVFRIVQECLTNIHRHSGSKTAAIRLSRKAESISLEIEDNGKGIPAEQLTQVQPLGVGITGMRERVRHFGGVMNIQSNDKGTKIAVVLPASMNAISEPRRFAREAGATG